MNKIIWKSKKRSWKWGMISTGKAEVWWLWKITINRPYKKYKQWFAYIHTPLFRFGKNNCEWSIGISFGKYFIDYLQHF